METPDKGTGTTIVVPEQRVQRRESSTTSLPAVTSDAPAIMQMIERAARDPSSDPDKMVKLYDIYDRERAREARRQFVEAITEFKNNAPRIVKDKHVFFEGKDGKRSTDYWHATLPNVVAQVIGGLASVGISHRWEVKHENHLVYVTCILSHVGGHSERTEFPPIPPDDTGNKNRIQAIESAITYAKRSTLLSATGLAAGDDDDGRGAGKDYERITEQQAADLEALIQEVGANKLKLLEFLKLRELADIPASIYKDVVKQVEAKRK